MKDEFEEGSPPDEMPEESMGLRGEVIDPEHPHMYYYDGDTETFHPVMGRIVPGANDLTGYPKETIEAAELLVDYGILRRA